MLQTSEVWNSLCFTQRFLAHCRIKSYLSQTPVLRENIHTTQQSKPVPAGQICPRNQPQNNHIDKTLAEYNPFKTQLCTHRAVLFCAECWHQLFLTRTLEFCSILLEVVNMSKSPKDVLNKILWKVKRVYLSPKTSEDTYSQSETGPLCDRVPSTVS